MKKQLSIGLLNARIRTRSLTTFSPRVALVINSNLHITLEAVVSTSSVRVQPISMTISRSPTTCSTIQPLPVNNHQTSSHSNRINSSSKPYPTRATILMSLRCLDFWNSTRSQNGLTSGINILESSGTSIMQKRRRDDYLRNSHISLFRKKARARSKKRIKSQTVRMSKLTKKPRKKQKRS